MPHQLVSATIVGVPLIQNVLTYLVKRFSDVRVLSEDLIDNCSVHLVILVIDLLFINEMQVFGQVLFIPNMFLDLLQRDPLDRIGLQHTIYQVLDTG